jgi:hypothetical protein
VGVQLVFEELGPLRDAPDTSDEPGEPGPPLH